MKKRPGNKRERLRLKTDAWRSFMVEGRLPQYGAEELVSESVIKSWERCLEVEVDPFELSRIRQGFVSHGDLIQFRTTGGIQRPKETLKAISHFADENRVVLAVYDSQGNLVEVLNHDFPQRMAEKLGVESLFMGKLSEEINGTNAVSLAVREAQPIRLEGCDHFHSWFHPYSCSAAPMRDSAGKATGAIGASSLDVNQPISVLPFIQCVADLYQQWRWFEYDRNRTRYWNGAGVTPKANPPMEPPGKAFQAIVGRSKSMQRVREACAKAAATDLPVMIIGESGTGKELAAQAIHQASSRRNKPLMAVNCGAVPEPLMESIFFGHEPGAFTGALSKGNQGKLEKAQGGTLFLDEVDSMPTCLQVILLRPLSEKVFSRVGGGEEIPLDVRIIAATTFSPEAAMGKGLLRPDFCHRINVLPIYLPPLRERQEDLPELMDWLLKQAAQRLNREVPDLKESVYEACRQYSWPGNVRELKNVMERLLLTCEGPSLHVENLPADILETPSRQAGEALMQQLRKTGESREKTGQVSRLLKQVEAEVVRKVLEEEGNNISRSARRLGISRPTLYKILKEISLQ